MTGNLMDGLLGYHQTFLGAALAYLSDIGDQTSRSFRFTLLSSMMLLSGAVSNVVTG